MGRRVDVDQLVGASDLAERLGYTRVQTVHSTRRRDPTFPEPVAFIGGGPQHRIMVWYWPDVAAWAKRKGITPNSGGLVPRRKSPKSPQAELAAELERVRAERVELAELRDQLGDLAELRERVDALHAHQSATESGDGQQAAGEG